MANQGVSTDCTEKQGVEEKTKWRGQDSNASRNSLICNDLRKQSTKTVGETVGKSKVPSDLQKVITHWSTLPDEIKQTILTLIKHARRTK
jgi:hypothetical protein